MSYTKGPWKVDGYPDGGFNITGKGGDVLYACVHSDGVADIVASNPHDARLIAAAPELLEALQKLERYFVSGNCIPIERAVITRDSFEEIARAAIEKATKP